MSLPFGNTRRIRFFDSFGEVKETPFCELNDGSGNPLDPALLGIKYKKMRRLSCFDSWSLWRTYSSTRIYRPKLLTK